ncbi:MAG: DUF3014 domain-containing protein [Gammaproteobacteria bacterium]
MNKTVSLVISVLILGGAAGGAYYFWAGGEPEQAAVVAPPAPAVPAENARPTIRYPVVARAKGGETAQVKKMVASETVEKRPPPLVEPLPALDASDPKVGETLGTLVGYDRLQQLFNIDNFVRRIVVTVDNLPRRQVPPRYLPTQPVGGRFQAQGEEGQQTLSEKNYARYSTYVRLLEEADLDSLITVYSLLYPLFQEAYEDLGYPDGYFNDRVVEAIDDLLKAPELRGPVKLVRPSVMFKYADTDLERLSAGQKIMIRMGPENAARVKARLRAIRHELTRGATMAEGGVAGR